MEHSDQISMYEPQTVQEVPQFSNHQFDFKPGALVLICNSCVEESLNCKMKPRYTGPMVIVQKIIRTSYIIAELNGAKSEFQVAGFCLIPYFPRVATAMPIVLSAPKFDNATIDDPEDVQYLASLPAEN